MAQSENDTLIPTEDERQGPRISTGSDYIDRAMRGGIPFGSVTLIEGPSNSGKSVLCQHIAFGALTTDLLVAYYVSRGGPGDLASGMLSLGMDATQSVETGQLIPSVSERVMNPVVRQTHRESTGHVSPGLVEGRSHITRHSQGELVLDDLTRPISGSDPANNVNFVVECRSMSTCGPTVLIAVHTAAFDRELV